MEAVLEAEALVVVGVVWAEEGLVEEEAAPVVGDLVEERLVAALVEESLVAGGGDLVAAAPEQGGRPLVGQEKGRFNCRRPHGHCICFLVCGHP